jgi:hypothetical protein
MAAFPAKLGRAKREEGSKPTTGKRAAALFQGGWSG